MKYRKKPVVIEAVQFNGPEDIPKIHRFCPSATSQINNETFETRFIIPTLEGDHIAKQGDYIIKGVKGEFYPCKPDIFEMTYEALSQESGE